MKVSKSLITALFLSALNPLSASALTIGPYSPPSESGTVFAPSPRNGISISRIVEDDGDFDNITPTLSISYLGPLAQSASSHVEVYIELNGRSSEVDGVVHAVPMRCSTPAIDRGGDLGTPQCDLSFLASATDLFKSAPANQPWNIELAFTDGAGNWDKAGDWNFRTGFPAAIEAANPAVGMGPLQIAYQASTDSLQVTYTPQQPGHPADIYTIGVLDEANASPGGLYLGALSDGQPLPAVELPLQTGRTYYGMPQPNIFQGSLALSAAQDGPMAIYFFDPKGNYDSHYGKNYVFNLRRK